MHHSPAFLRGHYLIAFIALPFALALLEPRGAIYSLLWLAALLGARSLHKHYAYDIRLDWNFAGLRAALGPILLRFVPFALALLLFTWFAIPERLFSFPLERPGRWALVMLLYPILSAFPQEILFRSFFFRYYAPIFATPRAMILANALAFGWVHIVLWNWVAVVFSFIGGLLFAHTYHKTKSLAAVLFEHALYGCYIFTLGLGWYFYHGSALR